MNTSLDCILWDRHNPTNQVKESECVILVKITKFNNFMIFSRNTTSTFRKSGGKVDFHHIPRFSRFTDISSHVRAASFAKRGFSENTVSSSTEKTRVEWRYARFDQRNGLSSRSRCPQIPWLTSNSQ